MKPTRFAAMVTAFVLCTACVWPSATAHAQPEQSLGEITHYNGIVFGEFSSQQADIEGALAVGGTSHFGYAGYYDVGAAHDTFYDPSQQIGHYTNENGYPTLLLGDEVKLGREDGANGSFNVIGGPLVMSQSLQAGYEGTSPQFSASGGVVYVDDAAVNDFFADARQRVDTLGEVLLGANEHPDSYVDFGDCDPPKATLKNPDFDVFEADNLVGTGGAKVLVVNFTNSGILNIQGPQLCESYYDADFVIFNFPDVTVANFNYVSLYIESEQMGSRPSTGTNYAGFSNLCHSVVWNFPNATQINTQSVDIVGSVLAPNATFTADGGSLNGMLVAQDFHTSGSMELHAFRMSNTVWDWRNPREDDPTGSVELIKYGEDDAVLPGAQFRLEYYDEVNLRWATHSEGHTSDGGGRIRVDELPLGSYRFVETRAPEGYVLDDTPIDFKINEESLAAGVETATATNQRQPASLDLVLYKTDGANALPGALFTFYEMRGDTAYELYDVRSDAAGEIHLPGLEPGAYRLVEVSPPYGYEADEATRVLDITIERSAEGLLAARVVGAAGELEEPYTVQNRQTQQPAATRLEIIKLDDADGRTALRGAEFDLYLFSTQSGEYELLYEALVTDENGQIILDNIPFGEYMLEEVKAPDGYSRNVEDENAACYYRSYFLLAQTEEEGWQGTYLVQHDVYNAGDTPETSQPPEESSGPGSSSSPGSSTGSSTSSASSRARAVARTSPSSNAGVAGTAGAQNRSAQAAQRGGAQTGDATGAIWLLAAVLAGVATVLAAALKRGKIKR